jgi:hypothetical protein
MSWAQRTQLKLDKFGEALSGADRAGQSVLKVGARFFESKPPHHVWIVSKIYTPPASTLPHVLLDRCGKFPASKLLSVEALADTAFFRKDRRDPFQAELPAKRRRSNDPLSRS